MSNLPKYVTRDTTASGNERLRFQRRGFPKVRLPDDPTSPEFKAAYEAALKAKPPEIGEKRTIPGTINQLIVSFYQSTSFAALAASTRDSHRWRLEKLRVKHGNTPAHYLDSKHLHAMLAKLTPINQKNWIKTFRLLYRHATDVGLAERDPSHGYRLPKVVSVPHRRWEDEDIAQYEAHHPIGTKARLALALLRYTGLRKSDIVRLGPQHIRKGRIHVKTQKTGKIIDLPLNRKLAEIIAATIVIGATSFLVTKHGKQHTAKGFGSYIRQWCNEAGLPDLSAHGVRHTVGCQLAEREASTAEIMAVLGHRDPRMAMHYTSQASQSRLADNALAKLNDE